MVAYTLQRLNTKSKLGITITSFDDDFNYISETIDRYGLQRRVRVGIAQPIVGRTNDFLHPSRYREVGATSWRSPRNFMQTTSSLALTAA